MINISSAYQSEIVKPSRKFQTRVTIGSSVLTGDNITSLVLEEAFNSADELTMGCACSSTLKLGILMPEEMLSLTNATIVAESGLLTARGVEWVSLGTFYVAEIESANAYKTANLTAYDGMCKMEKPFDANGLGTVTLEAAVRLIAGQCNILIDETTVFPEYSLDMSSAGDYTCRTLIGYMAGLMGKNARFRRDGKLGFDWYIPSSTTVTRDLQNQGGFELLTGSAFYINALTSGTQDHPISLGSGTGITFENPFMTPEIAQSIFDKIKNTEYIPSKLAWRGNPAVEVSDIIAVLDKNDQTCTVMVMTQTLTLSGGCSSSITCSGKTESEIAISKSPTSQKLELMYFGLTAAMKDATEKLKGEQGGYFIIETDELGHPTGWRIQDTPTLTPSTKLWRFGMNGFAYSEDGGISFKNIAITMDGSISANAVTAGFLSAERIAVEGYDTENPTALSSYIRFGEGIINIGQANNDLTLRLENDRISFIFGDQTVAYISNDSFEIEAVNKIRFGNFSYYPRKNGNLTFTKVVN